MVRIPGFQCETYSPRTMIHILFSRKGIADLRTVCELDKEEVLNPLSGYHNHPTTGIPCGVAQSILRLVTTNVSLKPAARNPNGLLFE